ncbi:4-hydroxyphenylacetate 3-hydroxylase N-terminal domain-containing protein [Xenorhabdus szentirmaii]|nr:4-hydroxyphenylacetate 3-hydroxylase N-terminal domain-containing protein [Xenorhabdus sp. 38]
MEKMMRTGEEYINALRDGRTIFINGEKITNHVDHPAFRNSIRTIANLYDYKIANPDKTAFKTKDGKQISLYWQYLLYQKN